MDHLISEYVRNRSGYFNPAAKISKSLFFKESNTLVYSFSNDCYCQNVERSHKSNAVYYVVDIDKMEVQQKCFDPDCRFYKSPPYNLNFIVKSKVTDDDLIASLEEFEKENNLMS